MTTHWRPENHRDLSSRNFGWKSKVKADKAVCTLKVLGRVLSCHFPAHAWCSLACGSIAPISCHLPVCLHVVLSPCVSVCFASSSKDAGHRIWGSSSTRMTSVDLMTSTKTLFSNKVAPTDIGIRSSTLGGRRDSPHLLHELAISPESRICCWKRRDRDKSMDGGVPSATVPGIH